MVVSACALLIFGPFAFTADFDDEPLRTVFDDVPFTTVFVDAAFFSLLPWAWAGTADAVQRATAAVAMRILVV